MEHGHGTTDEWYCVDPIDSGFVAFDWCPVLLKNATVSESGSYLKLALATPLLKLPKALVFVVITTTPPCACIVQIFYLSNLKQSGRAQF